MPMARAMKRRAPAVRAGFRRELRMTALVTRLQDSRSRNRANEVLVIGDHPPDGDPSAYEYANLIITGLARLRAQVLDTNLRGIAVWDGLDANGREVATGLYPIRFRAEDHTVTIKTLLLR